MQERNASSEDSALRATLLEKHAEGRFLEAVYRCSLTNHEDRDDLALQVAALHNEGLVDVVAAFEELKTKSANGPDFFLTRHVFEQALPHMNAEISSVMRCVLRLYRDAGQDMAAGMILDSFIGFCIRNEMRPRDALALAEENPDDFADLLPATVVAGSRIDSPRYLAAAVRLCGNPSIELRRRAAFAIGRIQWPEDGVMTSQAFAALERCVESESDDNLLAGAIRSAFALSQKDKSQEQRATTLIREALSKGDEYSLHAASEIFSFSTNELSPAHLDVLLAALVRVKPGNKGTLDNIDYGIDHLLRKHEQRGIEFLEQLLLAHSETLSLSLFDSVVHSIEQRPTLMGKLVTRWLLKGERVLCDGLYQITTGMHGAKVTLAVDSSELVPKDGMHILFVARKAVGYLHTAPLMAASIIVSLMRESEDGETLESLKALLFDPVLLSFPGIAESYLANEAKKGDGPAETVIADTIRLLDAYFEVLNSIGPVPELHPSEEQREAHMRHFGRQVAKSLKEAEQKSVFLSIISKSVLLYGRKSIDRIYGPSGQPQRMETALKSHSTTIDYPRVDIIDPVGLDYLIRILRVERFKK